MDITTSWTRQAYATDVELYEATFDENGEPPPPPKGISAPKLVEVGLTETLLMQIVEQLQAVSHYTAGAKGKPKIKHLPRPETAPEVWRRTAGEKAYQEILSIVRFNNET